MESTLEGTIARPDRARRFPKLVMVAGTLGQGGAERQLYYMLKTLRAHRADVRLLTLTQGEFWEEPIRRLGVPVTWVGQSQGRLRRLFKILGATRQDMPEIIQSAHFYTNLYVAAVGRLLGIPEIGAIRNNVISEAEGVLGRMSLKRPRFLAANSRPAVEMAERSGVRPGRCSFLPNVVDTALFQPGSGEPKQAVALLAVGRLVQQKRMDRFLRVVSEVKNRTRVPIRALIAGEGPQRADLEQQARSLGETVQFCGAVADMAPVYREADLLVLCSDWEGTPNVVMEAMACGLPVVSTAVGGVADLVRSQQTGLLVPSQDESALAGAVLRLVEDAGLRRAFGQRARETIVAEHSLENLAVQLETLYQRVLQ